KLGHGGLLARSQAICEAQARTGASYGDSATVGAGLPLLRSLRGLVAGGDHIHAVEGVLSGSLAWLFNRYDGSRPFSALVAEAASAGYTEPDPRVDLSGEDVRRKLLILARAAGLALEVRQVQVESLVPPALAQLPADAVAAALPQLDAALAARLQQARAQGGVLRFVGRFDADGAQASLQVLPAAHPLAAGAGTDNRVAIRSDRYREQPLLIQGPGAGGEVAAAGRRDDVRGVAACAAARGSALDDVDRRAAAAGFLVLVLHVAAGVAHGADHLVQRDLVLAVAAHGHAHGVDRLDRAHRVALDAGNLHQAADRVAGQAQVVLHADLGGVLDLAGAGAERRGQPGGGHRTGHADLALAADLGAGDRGILLVEDADRRGGEQEVEHALLVAAGAEAVVVVQHRRDDAGRAVGRGGDHASAGGVLLVHRQGVEVDPVQGGQRIAHRRLRLGGQLAVQARRAPRHVQAAGEGAVGADAARDADLHRVPDRAQAVVDLRFAAPCAFVGEHHPRDRQAAVGAALQQLVAAGERVGQRGVVRDDAVLGGLVRIDHEAAAHRVVV